MGLLLNLGWEVAVFVGIRCEFQQQMCTPCARSAQGVRRCSRGARWPSPNHEQDMFSYKHGMKQSRYPGPDSMHEVAPPLPPPPTYPPPLPPR